MSAADKLTAEFLRRLDRRLGRAEDKRERIGPNFPRSAYSQDQTEFIMAMERYMRENRRPFRCWHEVLEVLKSLGYRKVDKKQ